jgi:Concanavalin A-like lectin/glucanases superfamily
VTHLKRIRFIPALLAVALLAACSGGAKTVENPPETTTTVASYSGPAPSTSDIQAFQVNLWQNITASDRCGNCHKAGGQSPMFARSDDVNLAYNDAVGVVNLVQPDQSRMVVKVAGGHNCWLSSAQACADILTTWIRSWAGGTSSGGTQVALVAPPDHTVGSSKTFPSDSALFGSTVYPLLSQFCARCHSSSAAAPQSPFFASSDVVEAYAAVKAKINLDNVALSRLYVRLHDENHNCWIVPGDTAVSCPNSSARMLTQLQAFATGIAPTQVDPTLTVSGAVSMYEGTIASGGNRYEGNMIAKYQFKEGTGAVAFDTSGVEPALNLTVSGDVNWVGGWGLQFGPNGGKAQATVATSRKLYDQTRSSGEYSVELWATPANVAQEDAFLASYSGGVGARNFTLAQRAYQYQAFGRSSATDGDGAPALLTRDADRDAQASLQHVVLTYSPLTGRKLYVNGNYTGDVDAKTGGTLAGWDDTFAFLLGNETSSNRKWAGTVRFAAVYKQALTQPQVQQNFAAGVGERYFVLFNVSALSGMAQSYVLFDVSRYDSYSYAFSKPVFISLNAAGKPGSIPIKGIRIGINGREAPVGQAYNNVDMTVTDANYSATTGQRISDVGTIIALEKGPDNDQFFLTFERIGSTVNARTEPVPAQPGIPPAGAPVPDVGVRVFNEMDASLSEITGIARTDANVKATYQLVEQQLPTVADAGSFLASHQVGIAQLAIQYCDSLVESNQASSFFPGLNLAAAPAVAFADPTQLTNPLIDRGIGIGLNRQPLPADVRLEINSLINNLSSSTPPANCTGACRTRTITKAACAAVLGSAAVLVK